MKGFSTPTDDVTVFPVMTGPLLLVSSTSFRFFMTSHTGYGNSLNNLSIPNGRISFHVKETQGSSSYCFAAFGIRNKVRFELNNN